MRLYLSSFDVGDRPEELVALTGAAKRAAIILNALDHRAEGRSVWLKDQTDKLVGLGLSVFELDLRKYFGAAAALGALLDQVDVVWINGGNTFILRRAMKQSGFDFLIKDALAGDQIVYAGFSAAAVVAATHLKGLEIVDDPNDVPDGYDAEIIWDGLGLVPFSLAVHFKSHHPESKLVDREIDFYRKSGIPYQTLRDGEALIIDGGRQRIVGSRLDHR
jgi:dipeptidase E